MRAFRRRLRLPMRHNGAGLIGVDTISAAAFTGSVVAAAHADPILLHHLDGLTRFAQPALAQLQARFAPLGADASNALLKLPMPSPADLFDPSRYVEPDSDEKLVVPKLQQRWSRSIHEAACRTLVPDEEALGHCDLVHSQARARPAAVVLQLPLSSFASPHSSLSRGSASSSAFPSWPASPIQTPKGSNSASLAVRMGMWTFMATTRTPVSAGPPSVAEAFVTGS